MNKYQDSLYRIFDGLPKQYKRLGTAMCDFNLLKELVDRSIPKKPKDLTTLTDNDKTGMCECCSRVYSDQNFCEHCGQALDWLDNDK